MEMGYQDDIKVVAEEMNLQELQGTYTQWTEHAGVYADPRWVSLVVYPANVDRKVQRLICAKELVHICDANATKAKDSREIADLARALVDKNVLADELQVAGAVVATDMLAQHKALMLLFPKAARIIARRQIDDGQITTQHLEEMVQIPEAVLSGLLDPEWEDIALMLAEF